MATTYRRARTQMFVHSSLHCDVIIGGDLTASEFQHETFAGGACVRPLGGDRLAGGWRSRPVMNDVNAFVFLCDALRCVACVRVTKARAPLRVRVRRVCWSLYCSLFITLFLFHISIGRVRSAVTRVPVSGLRSLCYAAATVVNSELSSLNFFLWLLLIFQSFVSLILLPPSLKSRYSSTVRGFPNRFLLGKRVTRGYVHHGFSRWPFLIFFSNRSRL